MPGGKRHKIWLGAYGCPITRRMKYRVPQKLVEYLCRAESKPYSPAEGPTQEENRGLAAEDLQKNFDSKKCPTTELHARLLREYSEGVVGRVQTEGDESQLLLRLSLSDNCLR